ncbi:MAG: class I SAM-dependent methyltransferase [Candidatus Nomurabacteria bacterium]
MFEELSKQYNNFSESFSINQEDKNQKNRIEMYEFVGTNIKGLKVLDLCCGDGIDANYYKSLGAEVIGIDSSEKLLEIAKEKYLDIDFINSLAEELPFKENSFDAVYSKYAIMTSKNMEPIFDEIHRVLKSGGEFVYLVTHPLRQFIERRENNTDYFEQKIVDCLILDGTVKLQEPTHTLNEFFNKKFFERFEFVDFRESWDPAAEQINNNKYPCYFIIKAKKK